MKVFRILAVLFWILAWQLASMALNQEILLASPISVSLRLFQLGGSLDFWHAILFSFFRIVFGFFIALFSGIFLAVIAARFPLVEVFLEPLIRVTKSVPVASFIILCLIWIPTRNLSVFISFVMVLPVVYANIFQGIAQTDRKLLEMAQVFGLGAGKRIVYIYFSQILPYLLSAASLSLGLCWKAGIAAEVIGIPKGSIGERLYHARIYLNTPDLFAWTVVIIVISLLFERCFLGLLKSLVHYIERS